MIQSYRRDTCAIAKLPFPMGLATCSKVSRERAQHRGMALDDDGRCHVFDWHWFTFHQ
jgi:hypothetical protein